MKPWTRINGRSRKTKRIAAAGTALVVAVAAIWIIRSATGREQPRGQAGPGDVSGMEGTAGMQGMGTNGSGSVMLTGADIRSFGITFGTVEERTLEDVIRTVGIVNFDETRMAAVSPKFSGFVERLYVDFTGKRVQRGQPLLEIYSPELVAAQEELLLAARLEGTISDTRVPGVPTRPSNFVAAARQRLRLWDISDAQIDGILHSGRARRTLTMHSPANGIVVEKNVLRGQAVQAGQTLYTIADLSEVWVEAELREADAALIEVGDAATVDLAAVPGSRLLGRVEYVYPTLQQAARTLKARIAIPNAGGRLKPGMYATVRLRAPGRTALTVPISAVLNTGERRVVFVDMGGGSIMPHDVEIGRVAGDRAEVLSGLEPGQRVVTSAQYLLDSESNLAEVMKSMISNMNMSDVGNTDMQGMDMSGSDMKGMQMPKKER